jgi:hypothetical protein
MSGGTDDILLHATFTAMDPVYGAELCCTGQFTNDNIHSDSSFQDYIFLDEGRPCIDWDAFNKVRPPCGSRVSRIITLTLTLTLLTRGRSFMGGHSHEKPPRACARRMRQRRMKHR